MKRTEKYKDSYQYDDQYQQRNQKSRVSTTSTETSK